MFRTVKTLAPITIGDVTVIVQRSTELQEYRVRIQGRPDADYFTDDRHDAIQTAAAIAWHAAGLTVTME